MKNNLTLKLTNFETASSIFEKLHMTWTYMNGFEFMLHIAIFMILIAIIIAILVPKGMKHIPMDIAFALTAIVLTANAFLVFQVKGVGTFESESFTIEQVKHLSKSDYGSKYERVELKPKGKAILHVDIPRKETKNISPGTEYKLISDKQIINNDDDVPLITDSPLHLKKLK